MDRMDMVDAHNPTPVLNPKRGQNLCCREQFAPCQEADASKGANYPAAVACPGPLFPPFLSKDFLLPFCPIRFRTGPRTPHWPHRLLTPTQQDSSWTKKVCKEPTMAVFRDSVAPYRTEEDSRSFRENKRDRCV
ncbi:hypothetical protein JTE90_027191 [Oedothorax gibbosus]|uniref:Uncharacterized protein n=1 Tax=Oedothorax gibbosus TaxID=931172 RepID=A0AAV6TL42_9ARAC|nr:hypothetical protein JTE90_027191 [Oedothorax gibbosus]